MLGLKWIFRTVSLSVIGLSIASLSCAPVRNDNENRNARFPQQTQNGGGINGTNGVPGSNGTGGTQGSGIPSAHWNTIRSTNYQGIITIVDIGGIPNQQNFTMNITEQSFNGATYGFVNLQTSGSSTQAAFTFSGLLGVLPGSACSATYCFMSEIKPLNVGGVVADVSLAINLGFSQAQNNAITYLPAFSSAGFFDCSFGDRAQAPSLASRCPYSRKKFPPNPDTPPNPRPGFVPPQDLALSYSPDLVYIMRDDGVIST